MTEVIYRDYVSQEVITTCECEHVPQIDEWVVVEGEEWRVIRSLYYPTEEAAIVSLNPHEKRPADPLPEGESLEDLARLAHRLWVHWSKQIAGEEDISEKRLERWEGYWVPYDELPEGIKEVDRELVRECLEEDPSDLSP